MIENLNKQAFSPFGRVLHDAKSLQSFLETMTQKKQSFFAETACFYRTASELYLDFESGMTVLVLRKRGKLTAFYLDKPVCLSPDVEFAILPYQKECSVRMAYETEPAALDACPPIEDLKVNDRLPLGEIYTLFFRECESGFLFKGEQHSTYELTYVDCGKLHCVVDGTGYLLKQGQLMLFAPEQWHMQYTDVGTTARFLTVSFDMSSDLELQLHNRVFDLAPSDTQLLRQLLRELERPDDFSGDMIRANLKLLLLSLVRDTGTRRKRLKTPTALRKESTIVGRALQYVADHVRERLSVELVAREIGVSTSHLTALFHRQMNLSPGEYIRRVKLEESKALIREGKMNFSQIAATLQYSTIHHFSRQFKDSFGITPSEYAKSLKNEA